MRGGGGFANVHKGDMRIDSGIDSAESTVSIYAEEQSSANSLSDSVLASSLSISSMAQKNILSDSQNGAVNTDTSTQSNYDTYVNTPNNNDNNNNNYNYPPNDPQTDNTSSDSSSGLSDSDKAFLENYEFTELDDGTIRIDKFIGAMDEFDVAPTLVIPEEYNGKPITVLGANFIPDDAYFDIEKVVISDSVTTIEKDAFYYSNLKSFYYVEPLPEIHIGKNVKNIEPWGISDGPYVVYGDDPVATEITVDPDNEWFTVYDGGLYTKDLSEVVWYPAATKEVNMPDTVTSIRSRAFSHCVCLEELYIPNGVTELKTEALYYCYNLSKVMLPNTLEIIRTRSIYKCFDEDKSDYLNAAIPYNVKEVENYAFDEMDYRHTLNSYLLYSTDTKIDLDAQELYYAEQDEETGEYWGIIPVSFQEEWNKRYDEYIEGSKYLIGVHD